MNKFRFGIFFVLVLVFSARVFAISATPAGIELVYDPEVGIDAEFDEKFGISSSNTGFIDVGIVEYTTPFGLPEGTVKFNESQMKQYVKLSDTVLDPSKQNTVTIKVKIPPHEPLYGPQCFGISARERPAASSGLLTVTTAVLLKVGIDAPYPGQYLDITKFNIDNVNEGESTKMYWQVKGRSLQVTPFEASVEIKAKDGSVVFTRDLGRNSVARGEIYPLEGLYESLPTNTFIPGTYNATLTVKFADVTKKMVTKFNVGYESVALDNYTPKTLVFGEINEVTLSVRNMWNGQFNNVFGVIEISGDNISTIKTTTSSGILTPFGTLDLKQFMDVRNLPEGTYNATITITFDGSTTSFPAQFIVAKKVVPVVEEVKKGPNVYALAGVAAVVIILIILLILFFRRKKEGKKEEESKQESKQPATKIQITKTRK